MPVAPRIIVIDVSYVTKINHESHFAWQAQYLVRLGRVMLVAPRIVNDVALRSESGTFIRVKWAAPTWPTWPT